MSHIHWTCLITLGAIFGFQLHASASLIHAESFGTLPHLTVISTGNTSFDYIRGPSSTSLVAIHPSTISTGSSIRLTPGATVGQPSTTGFGWNMSPSDVTTLSFKLKAPVSFNSALIFGMGASASVSGTYGNFDDFSKVLWAMQISKGNIQNRLRSGGTWSSTLATLATATAYEIQVVANRSSSSVTYGETTLSAGRADLWINGVLAANVALVNGGSTEVFRLYSTGGNSSESEIDDIRIWDGAMPLPEPSAAILLAALLPMVRGRRRN